MMTRILLFGTLSFDTVLPSVAVLPRVGSYAGIMARRISVVYGTNLTPEESLKNVVKCRDFCLNGVRPGEKAGKEKGDPKVPFPSAWIRWDQRQDLLLRGPRHLLEQQSLLEEQEAPAAEQEPPPPPPLPPGTPTASQARCTASALEPAT